MTNESSQKKESFSNSGKAELLYNIGSVLSYAQILIFLAHAIKLLRDREKVHVVALTLLVCTLFGIAMQLPYKWDKRWMVIKSMISIGIGLVALGIYVYTLFFF